MSVILNRDMPIEEIQKILKLLPSGKMLKAAQYVGTIQLRENPISYQKRIRDEWN